MYSNVDGPVLYLTARTEIELPALPGLPFPIAHHTSNRSKTADDLALDD
jgi:hypothetical protein